MAGTEMVTTFAEVTVDGIVYSISAMMTAETYDMHPDLAAFNDRGAVQCLIGDLLDKHGITVDPAQVTTSTLRHTFPDTDEDGD